MSQNRNMAGADISGVGISSAGISKPDISKADASGGNVPGANVAAIKGGENKAVHDPLDLYQLSQAFESFSHRCAFIMVALDNIAFSDDAAVHCNEASYGAGYYVSDLLDELQLIQKMVDRDLKARD